MIIDSLITSVKRYFSTLSVPSYSGQQKVSLILANEARVSTGEILELDATESITLNATNSVISHPAESKQVYMDGVVRNPNKITIVTYIDSNKLYRLQTFADTDKWMYVVHSKNIGGTIPRVGYYAGSKLYHIVALNITDGEFKNSTKVQIELSEVVTYQYDVEYKFGIKQTNGISGNDTANVKGIAKRAKLLVPRIGSAL